MAAPPGAAGGAARSIVEALHHHGRIGNARRGAWKLSSGAEIQLVPKCERILLVEDEPDIRDLTAEIIEETGVAVDRCAGAAEALTRLRSGPRPDLILLDLAMPAMSGAELLSVVRADEAWRGIPVAAMSGYAEARYPGLRADEFLRKPFEIADLLAAIGRLCGTTSAAATGS